MAWCMVRSFKALRMTKCGGEAIWRFSEGGESISLPEDGVEGDSKAWEVFRLRVAWVTSGWWEM